MRRTLAQELRVQGNPIPSAPGQKPTPAEFCRDCKCVGSRKKYRPGTFRMEVWLWLLLLVPGIINLLWRLLGASPEFDDFGQMLAAHFPGVVQSLAALLSRYRAEPYGPDIEKWVFFLVPGVIYSCWRLLARYEGCAKCGSRRMVSMDSPHAQAYFATLTPHGTSQPWVCGKCGSQIFAGGRVCPNCGAELRNAY
jgi:hypothetical protein